MKKFIKVFLITFASLIAVLIIAISIAMFLVFTPERFTPIVRNQAEKYITCHSEIGEVELTFFSTFPDFGLKVRDFILINPVRDSQSDTLFKVDEFVGVIDAAAWWKRDEIVLIGLEMTGGYINIYSDSLGNSNYNIIATDTISEPATESETILPVIDIRKITLNDVTLHYNDLSIRMKSEIRNLSARISGTVTQDSISGTIMVKSPGIWFEYKGEKYLEQASVNLDIPACFIPSAQFIRLKDATVSINDLELFLDGSVENDTINKNIITNLNYKLSSWSVEEMVALVPPSFRSYLKGIDADGLLSSQGNITGILNDSVMPLMDIRLQMEKGSLKYPGFPLPLHDVEGDISLYTDLKTDSLSFVNIRQFSASTPESSLSVEGFVKHLFTDIYCNLKTTVGLTLGEFEPLIPDSLKLKIEGKAYGKIISTFTLSQLEKMQLEKMKLSGSLTLSDFYAAYDSISLNTDRSKIDFALPNNKASSEETKFALAIINTDNIKTGKLKSYNAFLQNASVTLETSDIRDTTRIPDLFCSFKMDSLSASLDTMSIAIENPFGSMSVSPGDDGPGQPRIILSYSSDHIKSTLGQSSIAVSTLTMDADVVNDNTQKDIFLQWIVKGFVDMNQGTINMAGLSHPIELPSVKMDFEPEVFNIRDSKIKIDKSDFQLTGELNNILSYLRGDSILRGNFSFVSDTTDILQLMTLTNGIGYEDTAAMEVKEAEIQDADTSYTGPYMVPKRIDFSLTTNIKTATMGIDTASNIAGSIQIHDGILVLDGLSFQSPAARIQLTAMYRTPRKNHLFLGLDYHMLDVEISELLKMIPDIDTLMPMLRSFSGKAEFHIAVETYLDSIYNLKKSTLRGASSIKGNNLVLMDGETFSEIAKTLKFNKKTENKVDSLSAEFTIFRNEIDIYPFLIVMDKYKAVVAGRHNFDMSFDYHISVVDNPLPIKLGVDIKGNKDDLSYSLAKCRYAEYYRPSSRHAVENKQLELRKLIRDALTQKVIE